MRVLAVALFVCLGSSAFADDGLRCGERLVATGEREPAVAAKCGPPSTAESQHRLWRTRGGVLRCTVDVWTYDRGPGEFVRTLVFQDGVLSDVAVGSYGGS